jgi:hypothetical protein
MGRFAALALTAFILNAVSTLEAFGFSAKGWLAALIGAAIIGGLILWVVVGRSAVGRLVATVWIAFRVGANLAGYAMILFTHVATTMGPASHVLSIAAILIDGAGLFYLWLRASTAWLQARPGDRTTGS